MTSFFYILIVSLISGALFGLIFIAHTSLLFVFKEELYSRNNKLFISAAAMPPAYLYRAETKQVEETTIISIKPDDTPRKRRGACNNNKTENNP